MPMRATTVRFSEDLWSLVEHEASAEGVSAAQFVRDAAVMRAAYLMGRRGDTDLERVLQLLGREDDGTVPEAPADVVAAVTAPARVRALRDTGLLDTPRERRFDRHAELAAQVLGAPVALVSLVDEDRQFFKSCLGLPEPWGTARETPLTHSFCQHAVARRQPLVIEDAREDAVLHDNLAIRDLDVVAYAGVPLIDDQANALGTLCVIDNKPRVWTDRQIEMLASIAAAVRAEIELDRAKRAAQLA
jgi:GAF domain-containing protein